jgi:hypothetical protein
MIKINTLIPQPHPTPFRLLARNLNPTGAARAVRQINGTEVILRSAADQCVIDKKEYHCTDDGDQNAVDIHASHSSHPEELKQISSDDSPDDAEQDIQYQAFAALIHELAGDKSCDQAEYNPCNK